MARPNVPGMQELPRSEAVGQAWSLLASGQHVAADRVLRGILQRDPKNAEALLALGVSAMETGNGPRAVDLIGRAARLAPGSAMVAGNLAQALSVAGRHREALAAYDRALASMPDSADLLINRGLAALALGEQEVALADFQAAATMRPDVPEAWSNAANALRLLGRRDDALAHCDEALALRPAFPAALVNRGNILLGLRRFAAALDSFDKALRLDPDLAAAFCNRGDALMELNRPDDALASFDSAIRRSPDMAEAHFGRALALLTLDRLQDGFRAYEWRLKRAGMPRPGVGRGVPWDGRPIPPGKTLRIFPEAQIGDLLMFCRYARLLKEQGVRVVLAAPRHLHAILSGLGVALADPTDPGHASEWHCSTMSLPFLCGTTETTIPALSPYLHADPDRVAMWRERLGPDGLKVGLAWWGSPTAVEEQRTIPLSAFAPLAAIPGIRLIGLQKGAGTEQLTDLPLGMAVEHFGADFDEGPDAFADTAAIVECLDAVVTIDSSVANLAAALGRPTWVLLKHVAEWRWGRHGPTTPWYPTARLFRQPAPDDWDTPIAEIAAALTAAKETHA